MQQRKMKLKLKVSVPTIYKHRLLIHCETFHHSLFSSALSLLLTFDLSLRRVAQ